MLKRRAFISQSAAAAAGALVFSKSPLASWMASDKTQPVGLQLFTLFGLIDQDVPGSLKKVSAIGYKEIESAFSRLGGYYGMKPKEFASLVSSTGMTWKSHHVLGAPFKLPPGAKMPTGADGKPISFPPMKNLRENMQELVDEVAEGGVSYLVCANTPIGSLDEIKSSIDVLNRTGEACKKAGLQFAYHNHDAEFRAVEGEIPYHLLLSQTNADNVKMELDLAWATKGGVDPVFLFEQHPGRFPLWHVKDITADFKTLEPVGEGTIDFKRIFAHAEVAGMKYFFVEHDMATDPYASIATSYQNLRKMGV
jgi:sugar phosphate isomerase/epimerase